MNKKCADDRKLGQGYVDLKKQTVEELKELLARQDALIINKKFIMSLADKGGKLMIFRNSIHDEIKRRMEEEDACALMAGLQLNSVGDMEWKEAGQGGRHSHAPLDSDDESDSDGEVDPLKLIATHSGTLHHARREKSVKEDPPLITKEDLYTEEMSRKYGEVKDVRPKFRTNEPKAVDSEGMVTVYAKSGSKVKEKLGKRWEVTAATPPVPVHGTTSMISIAESLDLQKEQAHRLKEIETKHAAERLASRIHLKMGSDLPAGHTTQYRTPRVLGDSFEGSRIREEPQDTYYDEGDAKDGGGVTYGYNSMQEEET